MMSGYPGCLRLLSGYPRVEECDSLFVCAFRPSHEASHVVTIAEMLFFGGRTPVARDSRKGHPVCSTFCTHCSPCRERNRMCNVSAPLPHLLTPRPRVMIGLLFYPRGGSAHVVRSLACELTSRGWDVSVVSGSLSRPGLPGDARTFFSGLDLHPVDYTPALDAPDPLLADPPLHPSYEDRPGAPDRIFAAVDETTYEHLVTAWTQVLRKAGAEQADLLHLHHLTPLNEAAARLAPNVPILGHLHGTELLMLEAIAQGPPASWTYAHTWVERMRRWAQTCQRVVVSSTTQLSRAQDLLALDPQRIVLLPNGFDPQRFDCHVVQRPAMWRRILVENPLGWSPGGAPGSIAYTPDQFRPFCAGPVLLYAGRFTAVKRVDLLIRAYMRARISFAVPAPLVLLGGFPGEWEGEHPFETITRLGARDVFLAGWHDHNELPDILAASDVIILPSVQEQFGQVLVEGMACGLPAIAVATGGPSDIVADGHTGWLVAPDDEQALAEALVMAVNNPTERRRRGMAAHAEAHSRYAWPIIGTKLVQLYQTLLTSPACSSSEGVP